MKIEHTGSVYLQPKGLKWSYEGMGGILVHCVTKNQTHTFFPNREKDECPICGQRGYHSVAENDKED